MSYVDLRNALVDWPYDPEQISVRKIIGMDGAEKIQMRVELGLLQMEAVGRPDGTTPFAAPSLLDHHLARLAKYRQRNGTEMGFALSAQQCEELRNEASIYYRRFVSYFVLEEYDKVSQDTAHNLALFDLCREYALEREDRSALEVYRPYLVMMDARACAHHALHDNEPASALAHVNRGITHLRSFFDEFVEGDPIDIESQSSEMRVLRELAKEILEQIPEDSLVITRKALRAAIEEERFEEAAKLRDTLKGMGTNDWQG